MDKIMLGMPGPWADDNCEVADHYTTKIGGLPDWPIPNMIIRPDLLECRMCKSKLCLLAQIYAPISSTSLKIEERVLYIFGCLMPECGSKPSSFRALRVQKSLSSEEAEKLPSDGVVPFPTSSLSAPKKDWREDLWTFDSGEDGNDGSADDIDLEELSRAFSEAVSLSSSSKKQNHDPETAMKPSHVHNQSRANDNKFPVLPCFYIYSQEDKISKETKSLVPIKRNHDLCDIDDHEAQERWEEESYEYDRALNADRTYLKFKKQIDANPEQCFRYSYGGKPLLATSEKGDSGNCSLCGVSRQYEMQLMPPLLFFLHEATSDKQNIFIESWNWMTLIVNTCSKSCAQASHQEHSGNQDWTVAEEAVVVQFE